MPLSALSLHAGSARGRVLKLDAPLSFWGGTNHDGQIIDRHHPNWGEDTAGKVLVMRSGRGSSSSSYVLTEQLRRGTGPIAIVLAEPDAIVALGAIVAHELYGTATPVVMVADADLDALATGQHVTVVCDESVARVDFVSEGFRR